jgi:hypothetical protein
VLPEENTTPKLSVQDIVALDNARIDLPGVIAIRVWIGRDGGTIAAGSAARFPGAAGRAGEAPTG